MYLKRLSLKNFRNLRSSKVELSSKINIIVGDNAQGKTNFIEAIYFLANAVSFRAKMEEEIINWEEKDMQVRGEIEDDGVRFILTLSKVRGETKKILLGHKPITKVYQLIGRLNVVITSSRDIDLIAGEPTFRRRYLDMAIPQIRPAYYYLIREYYKILKQRNTLLKEIKEKDKSKTASPLFAYNETLSKLGSKIMIDRQEFIENLSPKIEHFYQKLTDSNNRLTLSYKPSFTLQTKNQKELMVLFQKYLDRIREEEIKWGITLIGPQRDDFKFILNNVDLRIYGSLGEQKTTALALRHAEADLVKERTGKTPIFIFDDFQAFLDNKRVKNVGDLLITTDAQVFISATSLSYFSPSLLKEANVYLIKEGSLIANISYGVAN